MASTVNPRTGVLLFLLVFSICSCHSGTGDEQFEGEGARAAIVRHDCIEFWFPIENADGEWRWGVAGDNILEYAWFVRAEILDGVYELGYSRFDFPGGQRASGSLRSLIDAGQINIWKLGADGQGGTLVEGDVGGIVGLLRNDGILFRVTDPEMVRAFVSERPAKVVFRRAGSMQPSTPDEQEVTVAYRVRGVR